MFWLAVPSTAHCAHGSGESGFVCPQKQCYPVVADVTHEVATNVHVIHAVITWLGRGLALRCMLGSVAALQRALPATHDLDDMLAALGWEWY